jgi:hypothetical protein
MEFRMNKTKSLMVAAALATVASLTFAQGGTTSPSVAAPTAPSTAKKPAHSTAHPAPAKTTHHPSDAKHAAKTAKPITPAM